MKFDRSAGILLHPTSLPGPYGIGDLGSRAHDWLDFMVDARFGVWQILPLGPTGYADSPYQSFSSFAGNPLLINPDRLREDGLIDELPNQASAADADRVDFAAVSTAKRELFRVAYAGFLRDRSHPLRGDLEDFTARESQWLDDYGLYAALKDAHRGRAWTEWPEELRDRSASALTAAREKLADEIGLHRFTQFLFYRQWDALRQRARSLNITIVGDLPIYVAGDSSDVWAAPHLFRLNEDGRPSAVAGVPPDGFSETGQLWGNPLYDWEVHAAEGYAWWIERFRAAAAQMDVVRIDHFRGFADYWEVPPDSPTAEIGVWRDGPGKDLFDAVRAKLGSLPLIAEDLGDLSPKVPMLRDALGLPGMKVLQDAFTGDETHDFLPHRYPAGCVAYTGTHDNETAVGWYEKAPARQRAFARKYLDWDGSDPAWTFIAAIWESKAMLAVAPLQDFLRLGSEARMNTPATTWANWQWRARGDALTPELATEIRDLNQKTGRASRTPDPGPRTPDPA